MNTELIEEAKIVNEAEETAEIPAPQENGDDDLLKELSKVTETKTPGNTSGTTAKINKPFWEQSEEDFEQAETASKAEKNTKSTEGATQKETTKETGNPSPPKVTEKLKEGSARTAVGMFEFTSKLLFPPILNYKLKKKFEKSFSEKDQIALENKVVDAEKSHLDAAELALRNRFDRIMNKHQKKIDAVPLSKTEKEDLFDAFKNYFDYTETTLSPGWYLGMAIVNTMGRRAIDTFID